MKWVQSLCRFHRIFGIIALSLVGPFIATISQLYMIQYFRDSRCVIFSIFCLLGALMQSSADFMIVESIEKRFHRHIVPSYFLIAHGFLASFGGVGGVIVCCASVFC